MKSLIRTMTAFAIAAPVFSADVPIYTSPPPAQVASVLQAVAPPAPGTQQFSAHVGEVIRLAESEVEEPVILAFVETARVPFNLTADEVIYLKDIGLASNVVAAMLHQDAVLREQQLATGLAPATETAPVPAAPASPAAPSPAPVYVTDAPPQVTYFYESLAPYGTWIQIDDLGWCWQPRVVVIDRGWRPYWHGGRWIYSEHGWYWYSDYTWGWAPFHYGRWHPHPRVGWVWFPDLVWAPAWVSWRYTDLYCGWAPLPLGAHFVAGRGFYFGGVSVGVNFDFHLGFDLFTFVEIGHVHRHHPHHYGVPRERARDIYQNCTVINNHIRGRNNIIVNDGVPVGRVASVTGREIRPAVLRETEVSGTGARARAERLDLSATTPVVHRPRLASPATAPQAVAQRVDAQHPIVRQPARAPVVGAAPREGRAPVARPATTPLPRASRPATPEREPVRAPVPAGPARPQAQRPAAQRPEAGARPAPTPQRSPAQAIPRQQITAPSASKAVAPRHESPRGREQRFSNGPQMQRVSPRTAPAQPRRQATTSSRPAARERK